jgi:hypothetical protein
MKLHRRDEKNKQNKNGKRKKKVHTNLLPVSWLILHRIVGNSPEGRGGRKKPT